MHVLRYDWPLKASKEIVKLYLFTNGKLRNQDKFCTVSGPVNIFHYILHGNC